jgi:hypothetical protein
MLIAVGGGPSMKKKAERYRMTMVMQAEALTANLWIA